MNITKAVALVLTMLLSTAHTACADDSQPQANHVGLFGQQPGEPGFVRLFNGTDLDGWSGQPDCWTVRDGAIESTGKGKARNWLIHQGLAPADFELRLQFRFQKGNSGVQVRSKDIGDWQVRGYQVEIANHDVMGLWHHSLMSPDEPIQKTRKHLATAGQRVLIRKDATKTVDLFGSPEHIQSNCHDGEWNELVVIARGPRLIQKINGVVFSDLTDHQTGFASRAGVIAFQDHGKGTIAAFRNIRIRSFDAESTTSQDKATQFGADRTSSVTTEEPAK
tara:strand:+ start:49746 stop:50579 length:834 start_codon:yes stop_codon:yes gene_type:complete